MSGLYNKSRRYRDYGPGKKRKKRVKKLILFVFLFFILFNIISGYLFTTYSINSVSMEPAVNAGAKIGATSLAYGFDVPFINLHIPGFSKPHRGEVAVIKPAYMKENRLIVRIFNPLVKFFTLQKISLDPSEKKIWENRLVIKRIIGVPGDTIKAERHMVYIKPAGEDVFIYELELLDSRIELTYKDFPDDWNLNNPFSGNLDQIVLGENEYLLLSDNRGSGSDGMTWGISNKKDIKQKVVVSYWPKLRFRL